MLFDDPNTNGDSSSGQGSDDNARYIPSTDSSQRSIIEKGGDPSGEPLNKE